MPSVPLTPRSTRVALRGGRPPQAPAGTSSPPRCSQGPGNRSASSPNTASRSGQVAGTPGLRTLSTKCWTLIAPDRSSGSRSSGTAARAAKLWPGRSTSGTSSMPTRGGARDPAGDVPAVVGTASELGRGAEERRDRVAVATPRPDVGECRVGGDRHPPALVVGEVEVHPVEAPPRRHVDQPPDVLGRQELAGQVDVQPAPRVHRPALAGQDGAGTPTRGQRHERRRQRRRRAGGHLEPRRAGGDRERRRRPRTRRWSPARCRRRRPAPARRRGGGGARRRRRPSHAAPATAASCSRNGAGALRPTRTAGDPIGGARAHGRRSCRRRARRRRRPVRRWRDRGRWPQCSGSSSHTSPGASTNPSGGASSCAPDTRRSSRVGAPSGGVSWTTELNASRKSLSGAGPALTRRTRMVPGARSAGT